MNSKVGRGQRGSERFFKKHRDLAVKKATGWKRRMRERQLPSRYDPDARY